jgi:hypothetical protein
MVCRVKLLASNNGSAALHYPADDVMPDQGILMRDLITFVGDTYKFSSRPTPPPNIGAPIILQFQSGEIISEDGKLPIVHLILTVGYTIVTAQTTDIAEIILDNIAATLDEKLGYKIRSNIRSRSYQSNIVVQFNKDIDEYITTISKIETILNHEIPRPDAPFKIKRLGFGRRDTIPVQASPTDAIKNADFVIERRVGEPFAENRYFSSAPLRTSEHMRVLDLIEEAMRG